ncbi:carbohydrate porin [Entomobacter blattae]|uniref:carbohydrate porin n=1 Tax=Entomobacter blattae TaxID=2762277 RepID=UPI00193B8828|nr:carbohydrate porin [Entomobacter blattae]
MNTRNKATKKKTFKNSLLAKNRAPMLKGSLLASAFCMASLLSVGPIKAQTLEQGVQSSYRERVDTPLTSVSEKNSSPIVPPFANPESMIGDAGGVDPWLRSHGIGIILDTINEFAQGMSSVTPGKNLKGGGSNAGQVGFQLDLDWDKIAGIPGFATHLVTTSRYGRPSNRYYGDWLAHTSEIYGGGGNVAVKLVILSAEENLLGGRISIAAGRIPLLTDFASSNLFCNFMNNSFCGRPKSAGDNGYISTYPGSSWALRVRGRPAKDLYIQSGIYFPEKGMFPGPGNFTNRSGWRFSGSNIVGQTIPVEAGWEPYLDDAEKDLPGHYKIGATYQNVPIADNLYDGDNVPYPISGNRARTRRDTYSMWLMMDQRILHYPETHTKDSGLTLLGGAVHNAAYSSVRDFQFYWAILNRGFIEDRPYDTLGFAYSFVKVSGSRIRAEHLLQDQGKPFIDSTVTGIQSNAQVIELNYSIHVMDGVVFAPDFQYYFRPNAQKDLNDAAFIGFKSHVVFF